MPADRTIIVPSPMMGGVDATLCVETSDGETATMSLELLGRTIASSDNHRVAQMSRWTWLDMPERELVSHFSAFFGAAAESEEEARELWEVWTEEAADWSDALYMLAEEEEE